jgi:hypothetical protein
MEDVLFLYYWQVEMQYTKNSPRRPFMVYILVALNLIAVYIGGSLLLALILVALGVLHSRTPISGEVVLLVALAAAALAVAWGLLACKRWAYWAEILFILSDIGSKIPEFINHPTRYLRLWELRSIFFLSFICWRVRRCASFLG